jgi:stage IV sporulation protein A
MKRICLFLAFLHLFTMLCACSQPVNNASDGTRSTTQGNASSSSVIPNENKKDDLTVVFYHAAGAEEDGLPRMITTPWFDHEIPMTEAAELGTKKVMEEHCSIGLVITTDGTVTDIPREDYIASEQRAIADMKATGKPFLIIINSKEPSGEPAQALRRELAQRHGAGVMTVDCLTLNDEGISDLLRKLLYAFPMRQLQVNLPRWMDALEPDHPIKSALYQALIDRAEAIHTISQAQAALETLTEVEPVQECTIRQADLATGTVTCCLTFPEALYYEILSNKVGVTIQSDAQLIKLLTELSAIRKDYEKIADALSAARATGYGIVMPTAQEMELEDPQLHKKGGSFGVKLKAGASSIHMIRVDIDTQIDPIIGDEKQSRDLLDRLNQETRESLWQSNLFGRSVYDLIQEGLTAKLIRTPEDVRMKFRASLTRIINEGASGLICLIL